jgi:DNA-binding response OmpR family regulator
METILVVDDESKNDLLLPGLDGFSVCKGMIKVRRSEPVLVSSVLSDV